MSDTRKVNLGGKEFELRKPSLRRFSEFAEELDKFRGEFHFVKPRWWQFWKNSKLMFGEDGELGQTVEMIIYGLRHYPSKVAHLIRILTEIPEEDILEGSFEDVVGLVTIIWEQNNFVEVFKDALGKLTRRPSQ